jgi:predicted nucleic acid-binding protein
MKYYFDTCIWMDFLYERSKVVVERVFRLLLNHEIIVSELIMAELERHKSTLNLVELKNVKWVHSSEEQRKIAIDISKKKDVPFGDVLHAIIAKENNAVILTRDKHFLKLRDVFDIELL